LDDFVLVGHSMGGAVVLSYVLEKEDPLPRGLVLVDTAPQLDLSGILLGLAKEVLDQRMKRPRLEDNPDALLIKQYEAQMMTSRPQIMRRDLVACMKFDVTNRLSEITVPSFVLVGECDDVTPPKMAKELADGLPRADIAVIRNADHVPMLEEPEEFHRLLRNYLQWAEKNEYQL
jgi:pimeloyl-ACP methyl ester carboxylesterase